MLFDRVSSGSFVANTIYFLPPPSYFLPDLKCSISYDWTVTFRARKNPARQAGPGERAYGQETNRAVSREPTMMMARAMQITRIQNCLRCCFLVEVVIGFFFLSRFYWA